MIVSSPESDDEIILGLEKIRRLYLVSLSVRSCPSTPIHEEGVFFLELRMNLKPWDSPFLKHVVVVKHRFH